MSDQLSPEQKAAEEAAKKAAEKDAAKKAKPVKVRLTSALDIPTGKGATKRLEPGVQELAPEIAEQAIALGVATALEAAE